MWRTWRITVRTSYNINFKVEHRAVQWRQTHLIIFAVDQGQFEAVLCWVDGENTWPTLSVQTVNTVSPHTGHIDGQIQGSDDAMITAGTNRCFFYFKT